MPYNRRQPMIAEELVARINAVAQNSGRGCDERAGRYMGSGDGNVDVRGRQAAQDWYAESGCDDDSECNQDVLPELKINRAENFKGHHAGGVENDDENYEATFRSVNIDTIVNTLFKAAIKSSAKYFDKLQQTNSLSKKQADQKRQELRELENLLSSIKSPIYSKRMKRR